jgi:hypothetical protein
VTNLAIFILALGLAVDLALAALPLWIWLRHGRDPHFTDDDSVLMPSPPPDFTPALASVVLAGNASRRTIAAGLMDLASRDLIAFLPEAVPVGSRAGIGLTVRPPHVELPAPEAGLYAAIAGEARALGYISALFLGSLNGAFGEFTKALDRVAVQRGWAHASPGALIRKWRIVAGVEVVAGLILLGWLSTLLSIWTDENSVGMGVALVGVAAAVAGALTYLVSGWMPARTRDGAMLAAMLIAYRRTLKATIAQAQSLDQVVAMKPLPWVGTPTEEIAWAVAFGLDRQIDRLLSQSLEVSEVGGWPTGLRDWFSIL